MDAHKFMSVEDSRSLPSATGGTDKAVANQVVQVLHVQANELRRLRWCRII